MDRTEDRGVYRRIPVRIMGAYHVLPDPLFVPEQMENLVAEFAGNKKLNPIERAALFHLKFEGIHPFVDGNGRTGRLILNLMLMQAGYPPINVKYSDRKRYYEAFDSYYRDNDKSIFRDTIKAVLFRFHPRKIIKLYLLHLLLLLCFLSIYPKA